MIQIEWVFNTHAFAHPPFVELGERCALLYGHHILIPVKLCCVIPQHSQPQLSCTALIGAMNTPHFFQFSCGLKLIEVAIPVINNVFWHCHTFWMKLL
jgi:hypothetical protein